jgi:hypothetical protein
MRTSEGKPVMRAEGHGHGYRADPAMAVQGLDVAADAPLTLNGDDLLAFAGSDFVVVQPYGEARATDQG